MKHAPQNRVWVVPLIFAVLVAGFGGLSHRALQHSAQKQIRGQLESVLAVTAEALAARVQSQRALVEGHAGGARVGQLVESLVHLARQPTRTPLPLLVNSSQFAALREIFSPVVKQHDLVDFLLFDRNAQVLASMQPELVGKEFSAVRGTLERLSAGEVVLSDALRFAPGANSFAYSGMPVMLEIAPVADSSGEVNAALALVFSPARKFGEILSLAAIGDGGETYVFNGDGVLLAAGRATGADESGAVAPETPDRDAARGTREDALAPVPEQAFLGINGSNVTGYNNHRGVAVVGAWHWLPSLKLAVAAEVRWDEAYRTLLSVRRWLWTLIGLLLVSATVLVYSRALVKLKRAATDANQLGQYRVVGKIGEGGMGKVYRARHMLLPRLTAIKLIRADRENEDAIRRFEREVRLTSQFTHPNTIRIFDYGRTADHRFYYAMEYLEGTTLGRCVRDTGPQPEARVAHIMQQVCGSIAEAHTAGLVHRDIKPSNIMLCECGGLFDFVKVLDFGLIRAELPSGKDITTGIDTLTGTPLYLSPESIRSPASVNARSDVYQLGAIAYFALTGQHVFEGKNIYEVCSKHLNMPPIPPSERLGKPISEQLERIILSCLEKEPARRPANAFQLLELFEALDISRYWNQRAARGWWKAWLEEGASLEPEHADSTDSSDPRYLFTLRKENQV